MTNSSFRCLFCRSFGTRTVPCTVVVPRWSIMVYSFFSENAGGAMRVSIELVATFINFGEKAAAGVTYCASTCAKVSSWTLTRLGSRNEKGETMGSGRYYHSSSPPPNHPPPPLSPLSSPPPPSQPPPSPPFSPLLEPASPQDHPPESPADPGGGGDAASPPDGAEPPSSFLCTTSICRGPRMPSIIRLATDVPTPHAKPSISAPRKPPPSPPAAGTPASGCGATALGFGAPTAVV